MPKIVPVHWTVLEKIFVLDGWRFNRQEGSHRAYVKPGTASTETPRTALAEMIGNASK